MNTPARRIASKFGSICIAVLAWHNVSLQAIEISASSTLRTVALSGQPSPGLADDSTFLSFNAPSIDPSGQVAFHGFLQGPNIVGALNDEGIWGERLGSLSLAVREVAFAPPPNASNRFRGLGTPFSLSDGELAFTGYFTTTFDVSAVWVTTSSGLHQVNGPGFPVPDANGNPLADYTWRSLHVVGGHSSNDLLLFGLARHSNGNNLEGYWLYKDDATRLIVTRSDQPPGAVAGSTFAYINSPVFNSMGQLAFHGEVSDLGFGAGNNNGGIWTNRDGSLEVLAHSGSTAAEFGAGAIYSGFTRRHPSINDRGQILFHAYLAGPGITEANNQALILDDGTARRVVVQQGQPAPGTLPDLTFDRLDLGDAVMNGKGQVAFSGKVRGPNVNDFTQDGIWLADATGELHAIARGGDPAPGGGFFRIHRMQPFALNEHGQVAFSSALIGSPDLGIWATDSNGILQLIVRTGNQIELAPGDVRTVSFVDFLHREFDDESTGLHDGLRSGFNNRGEIAFLAYFDDGSTGVFVSSLVAVPEPATLAIGFLSGCFLGTVRLRRN